MVFHGLYLLHISYGVFIMQYLTAVYFSEKENKSRKDKVIYFSNPASDCVTASSFSKTKENHVINARPKAEGVHARTYIIGAVSYDLK